ncbi:hypothetical protein BD779DRAFT_1506741 [Infundibulicybe gibba]|nr:hypothetical protein BD779DRAFT_1506741 [Infundibulicybe gibba]
MAAFNFSGIICTSEEYSRKDSSIHCLSRGQSIGLTLVAESGFVSLIARNVARHINTRHAPSGKLSGTMDIFMLSLFSADFIQAVGAVMDVKWINDGKVQIGGYCTAQGVVQQFGETGVAMSTLVIAIYTFVGIWWRRGMGAVLGAKIIMVLVWIFIILMVVIGNATHADKSACTSLQHLSYWCWIGQDYLSFRIWGEYIWLWITLGFSIVAYVLLFFWSRGNITVNENSWWKFKIHRRHSLSDEEDGERGYSLTLLPIPYSYPVVYSILILPLSVVRWIGFVQERGGKPSNIASSATITVIAIYGLSGLFNVILLLTTRPNSILFGRRVEYYTGQAPSLESAQAGGNARKAVSENSEEDAHHGNNGGLELGRLPSRG